MSEIDDRIRLDRVRKSLRRLRYMLRKSRVRKPHYSNMGGYMIFDINNRAVASGSRYDLTLDDVEEFLRDRYKTLASQ